MQACTGTLVEITGAGQLVIFGEDVRSTVQFATGTFNAMVGAGQMIFGLIVKFSVQVATLTLAPVVEEQVVVVY